MNAETLHAILKDVQYELRQTNTHGTLNDIHTALQNQVNQPAEPKHQTELSTKLSALYSNLETAASNDFSPAWHQTLEELGATNILGESLKERLVSVFERNQITQSVALEEVGTILAEVKSFHDAVNQAVSGFEGLGIGYNHLEEGECEIGIVVPRKAVDNELKQLGAELKELDFIFSTFGEIFTGERPALQLRTISSSDFTFLLDYINPAMAAFVAVCLERLIAGYKDILEIRKLRQELSEKKVPDSLFGDLDEYINGKMTEVIKETIKEEIEPLLKSITPAGRKNELKNASRFALNKLANRVDDGYNFEVRIGEVEEPEEEEQESEEYQTLVASQERILKAAKELRFMNLEGKPILSLPESNSPEEKPNPPKQKGRQKSD